MLKPRFCFFPHALGILGLIFIITLMLNFLSCTHDPIDPNGGNPQPMDTTTHPMPTDTTIKPMPTDSTLIQGCDTNLIYFNRDILPIFTKSCAIVGCHDSRSATEGYIFTDYKHIISRGIVSGNPNKSKIYTVITTGNSRDIMPPSPNKPLTTKQIRLIESWITQGLKSDSCIVKTLCDTSTVNFSKDILPVFESKCISCHGSIVNYSGVRLDNYTNVKNALATGRLMGAILWQPGFSKMPLDQPQLLGCEIKKLDIWIRKGTLNN